MAFLETSASEEFLFLAFISGDETWETDVLDSSLEHGLLRYRGGVDWTSVASESGDEIRWSVEGDHLDYQRGDRRIRLLSSRGPGREPRIGSREGEGSALIGRVEMVRDDYVELMRNHRQGLSDLARSVGWTFAVHHTDRATQTPLLALYGALSERRM